VSEQKTILLVEDNPDDVELALRAFAQTQVASDIVVARDGAAALDYLFGTGEYAGRDASTLPQLVLLDLQLPRVDGLEVLRRIRSDTRTRLLPVVVLTSSTESRDLVGSYGLGANSYVQKPIDFAQFLDAARQLSRYWLAVNHPPPAVVAT
jgi:two-component system response regulator